MQKDGYEGTKRELVALLDQTRETLGIEWALELARNVAAYHGTAVAMNVTEVDDLDHLKRASREDLRVMRWTEDWIADNALRYFEAQVAEMEAGVEVNSL
jgi:hypothetical protein